MALSREYVEEMADEILKCLKSNPVELIAWGSKDFKYLCVTKDETDYPALRFSVRTPKIRKGGRVTVLYSAGTDTYQVEVVRVIGTKCTWLGTAEDIYADNLHNVINSFIEDEKSLGLMCF